MPNEPTASDFRRRDDEVLAHFTRVMAEQTEKFDSMQKQMHQMEIHMAELKVISSGHVEQLQYRIDRLESNNKTLFGSVLGIATAVVTAAIIWFFQHWGAVPPVAP